MLRLRHYRVHRLTHPYHPLLEKGTLGHCELPPCIFMVVDLFRANVGEPVGHGRIPFRRDIDVVRVRLVQLAICVNCTTNTTVCVFLVVEHPVCRGCVYAYIIISNERARGVGTCFVGNVAPGSAHLVRCDHEDKFALQCTCSRPANSINTSFN